MSKSKLTAAIQDYKSRHFPFKSREKYRHYLEGLMFTLMELDNVLLDFKAPPDYFLHYCYVYLNPLKPGRYEYTTPSGKVLVFRFEPFYVGKGKNRRAYNHLKQAANIGNTGHKCNTIREIWASGDEPIILITKSRFSDYLAKAYEIDLIAGIGRRDSGTGYLSNHTDGGEGISGLKFTKKSIRKMKESSREYWDSLSEEKLKMHGNKTSVWWGSLSKEEQRKITQRSVAAAKATPEQVAARSASTCRASQEMWDARSQEERDIVTRPMIEFWKDNEKGSEANKRRSATILAKRDEWVEKSRVAYAKRTKKQRRAIAEKSKQTAAAKPDITCPNCGATGRARGITRWHFDNCRNLKA